MKMSMLSLFRCRFPASLALCAVLVVALPHAVRAGAQAAEDGPCAGHGVAEPGPLAPGPLPAGRGCFVFSDWAGPAIPVFYAAPRSLGPDTPILFVHHGNRRNGDAYRDHWVGLVAAFQVLVVAPTFPNEAFPRSRAYNLGHVFDAEGAPRPRAQWSFSAVEPLFDAVAQRVGSRQTGYLMFGHSAGSQFVHRFAYHVPENRALAIVAANAGWYTLPDFEVAWPYGLKGSVVDPAAARAVLGQRIIVLLGEEDTDPEGRALRRTPEAIAQGPHRLARGRRFFAAAKARAAALDTAFAWTLDTVPGADHDNNKMAAPALVHLLNAAGLPVGPTRPSSR
ncbi:MAG: hypothetical protein ACFB6R_00070 [Alphaproteobacteria bacterium]